MTYEFLEMDTVSYRGEVYSRAHGSPFDRGSADSYYGRGEQPHWYPNGTGNSPRVESSEMSLKELRAYFAGYQWNEQYGDKKDWR